MEIRYRPIGYVRCKEEKVPRHWAVSDLTGTLAIEAVYERGLRDISAGDRIVVLFHFHRNRPFTKEHLVQVPPAQGKEQGVFSTCSPNRPNPVGMSVLTVIAVNGNRIEVRGLDMLDGTPVLDIKPFFTGEEKKPS